MSFSTFRAANQAERIRLAAIENERINPSIPSYINPNSQINPRYTGQQQPQSPGSYANTVNPQGASFAPMQMYQQFKQTGQAPQGDGSLMTKPTGGK